MLGYKDSGEVDYSCECGWVGMQYGVKISLITSFKDTCFVEIAPTEEKSKRGVWTSLSATFRFQLHCGVVKSCRSTLDEVVK